MRAVIDTNVIISALFWGGRPRRVVDLAAAGRFQAVTSPELLAELDTVLAEDFDIPPDRLDLILRDVLSYAELVASVEELEAPVRDAADLIVIACALAGPADVIVTGDRDLLDLEQFRGVRVLSVSRFLSSLG